MYVVNLISWTPTETYKKPDTDRLVNVVSEALAASYAENQLLIEEKIKAVLNGNSESFPESTLDQAQNAVLFFKHFGFEAELIEP